MAAFESTIEFLEQDPADNEDVYVYMFNVPPHITYFKSPRQKIVPILKNWISNHGMGILERMWLMDDHPTNPSSNIYRVDQFGFIEWLAKQAVGENKDVLFDDDEDDDTFMAEINLNTLEFKILKDLFQKSPPQKSDF